MDHLLTGLLPAFERDDRIESATEDARDLVLRVGGEPVRVSADAAHGRIVFWAQIRRLFPGETVAAAAASRRYNATLRLESGLTVGLHAKGGVLILGQSIEAEAIEVSTAPEQVLRLRDAIEPARSLFQETLETILREEKDRSSADGASLMRV